MRKQKRILYITPSLSTFVEKDAVMLRSKYEVKLVVNQLFTKKILLPFAFIFQFLSLCYRVIYYDVVIIMFAGYWSFLPTVIFGVFRKKSIIIAGGSDCVSYPAINYGSLRKFFLRNFIHWSFKFSSIICPVDESLIFYVNDYYNESKQGIKHFFPKLKTKFYTIYNGYIASSDLSISKEQKSFASVAFASTETRVILKGFDLIINNADKFPEATFYLAGLEGENKLFNNIPKNVIVFGKLSSEEINKMFAKCEFVIQASISEGFPNALCEAMLNGAVPIVSNVTAMPKIVGESGIIIDKRSDEVYIKAISQAMSMSDNNRQKKSQFAVKQIVENYSIERRLSSFTEII